MLNEKKLLTKLLQAGTCISHTGSKSVTTGGSVTNLVSEFTLPSSGLWLIVSDVTVTTTGSASANVHNRLTAGGSGHFAQIAAVKEFHVFSFAVVTSGSVKLDTFQNTGSTQTIQYELNCIKPR